MTLTQRNLLNYLSLTPWRQLLAIMGAHYLSTSTRQTKTDVIDHLHEYLTNPNELSIIVAQLSPDAKDALERLIVTDGALPVHTFETRYGSIRPYRPWRKDDRAGDPQPWLAPISATETLWYLDLIPHLTQLLGRTVIPNQPMAEPLPIVPHPGHNGPLDHHLAIWLATIHAQDDGNLLKPVHKRWLPPTIVARLCTRLGLDQDDGFTPIRSERHHTYLAFLHYLALAADLVVVTPTAVQLTPAGWAWLATEPATRHQQLYEGWVAAPAELAHPFRFSWEPLSLQARAFIVAQLTQFPTDQSVSLDDLVVRWRLQDSYALLPEPRPEDWGNEATLYDPLIHLLTGPLHWLGLVTLRLETVTNRSFTNTHSPAPPAGHCTMPKQPINTILAPINVQPVHLVRLARFCAWTIATTPTTTPHTFTLAPDQIAQLAAQGIQPEQLLEQLTAALGRQPSRRTMQRIKNWAHAGQQLRLRSLFVLEADTADRLAQLRRHKLVRNRLHETIAPNRMTLDPADATRLAQTLRTLGYYVDPPVSSSSSTSSGNEEDEDTGGLAAQLQWFLITLYQGLGQHLPLSIEIPWEVRQLLRPQLTPLQHASAETAANQVLDTLQAALNGYLQISAWQLPPVDDPAPTIRTALEQGHDIEIRYLGPSDGHATIRTVTPYWIEERHGIPYLIGWCHLRQQERVFRVDRIEAVRVDG